MTTPLTKQIEEKTAELSENWEEAEKCFSDDEKQLIEYAQDIWDRDWVEKSGEKRAFVNLFRSILRSSILSISRATLERVRELIEEKHRIKCICHGGGFKKTGNYFVCCAECKDSIQCVTNYLLSDLLTSLTEIEKELEDNK